MTSDLICIPPTKVREVWPLVEGMIDAAYAATDEITPDVRAWLLGEHGLLWIAARGDEVIAALTTSLVQKRSGLACRMVAAGGFDLDLWKDHHLQIEAYAKAEGCVKVYFEGRVGWMRVLPDYQPLRVAFEKEV